MPKTQDLALLFESIARGDLPDAGRRAEGIASHEQAAGHADAARRLRGALASNGDRGRAGGGAVVNGAAASLDGALTPMPAGPTLGGVVLGARARRDIADLAKEYLHSGRLQEAGIRRRCRAIFWGPPGCGKTMAARALAAEARLPIYLVRFDSVIGAYLGQTAARLRQIFRFAELSPCVLLFDEVDALGKHRGSPTDVGELDRVTIALMQELEMTEIRGMVVATSNLPGALDKALWRRFDLAVRFPAPSRPERARFVAHRARSRGVRVTDALRRRAAGLPSYAAIEGLIEDSARRAALRGL